MKERREEKQKNNLMINKKLLWVLLFLSVFLLVLGFYLKFQNHEWNYFMISFGITSYILAWLVLLLDMIKHQIYNKTFWIISMFILGTITPFFYLKMRDKLLRLGSSKLR